MAAKEVVEKMATDNVLPMEIWHEIWENLDFENRQKVCVLVSKTWKFEIRNQAKFSSEVKIKTMDHGNLLRSVDNKTFMPCPSIGPNCFGRDSSINRFRRAQFVLVRFKLFWTGPNYKN